LKWVKKSVLSLITAVKDGFRKYDFVTMSAELKENQPKSEIVRFNGLNSGTYTWTINDKDEIEKIIQKIKRKDTSFFQDKK